MPAPGNRVLTTTQDKLVAKLVDTVLLSNVFASRVLSAAKKWSGETLKFPIKTSKNDQGLSFSGFDTLSTTAVDTRQRLAYNAAFYAIPVVLPMDELSLNDTDAKVLDLMAIEMASTAQDAADDIGTMFYGDGTGNGSKDLLGLGALVDDGTSVATIGGLSRSTFVTLKGTVTASGGTLTLAKMRTLLNAVKSGAQKPTLGLCTEAVFGFYEQLLQPQERIAKDVSMMKGRMVGGTGFDGLYFEGIAILADEKCTAQTLFFINEDYLDFYGLPMKGASPVKFKASDIEGNDYGSLQGLGFSHSDWKQPVNQAAQIMHVYLGGNLVTTNPRRHGKLTGVTGV